MIPLANRLALLKIDLATASKEGLLSDDSDDSYFGFKLSPLFLFPLLEHHQLISFEYNVLCSELKQKNLGKITENDTHTKEQLHTAYLLAQLLEAVYLIYLNIPREAEKFYDDKACLRQYLQSLDYEFIDYQPIDKRPKKAHSGLSFVKKTRDFSLEGNFWRLLFARLKRVLDAIAPFAPSRFGFVDKMDNVLNPVFNHLGWTFYIPRLLVNLYGTAKHTYRGEWMSAEEKKLYTSDRLRIQLERRWFELANDMVWIPVGIMTCFVLVNALTPAGTYLTAGLYAYDVFLAAMRAHLELGRLEESQSQYQKMLEEAEPEDKESILSYKEQLDRHIRYQKMRFMLSITSTSLLFIGMCLTVPLIVTPFLLLIAVSFITVVCLANYIAAKYIERYKPADKIPPPPEVSAKEVTAKAAPVKGSRSFGLFKPEKKDPDLIRRVQSDNQLSKPVDSNPIIKMLPQGSSPLECL